MNSFVERPRILPDEEGEVEARAKFYYVQACGGCRQKIGISRVKNPTRSKLYCSELCAAEQPVTEYAERADLWDFLINRAGWTAVEVANTWKTGHSLVYRTVERTAKPVPPLFYWLDSEQV